MFDAEKIYENTLEKRREKDMSRLISEMAVLMLEEQGEDSSIAKKNRDELEKEPTESLDIIFMIACAKLLERSKKRADVYNKLLEDCRGLWECIYGDMYEIYEREMNVTAEFELIIYSILGKKIAKKVMADLGEYHTGNTEEKINLFYAYKNIIYFAQDIRNINIEEGDKIVKRLIDFKISRVFNGDTNYQKALMYYYLSEYYEDNTYLENAYKVLKENWWNMYLWNFEEAMLLSNQIAIKFEYEGVINGNEAAKRKTVELMSNTHSYWKRKDIPTDEYRELSLRYNYLYSQFLYAEKTELLGEMVELFYEMYDSPLDYEDFIETKVKLAYFILNHVVAKGVMAGNYTDIAEKFNEMIDKYGEILSDEKILNKKTATHFLSYTYTVAGQRYAAESVIEEQNDKEGGNLASFYNRMNLCFNLMLQNNLDEAKNIGRELYYAVLHGDYPNGMEMDNIARVVLNFSSIYERQGYRRYAAKIVRKAIEKGIIIESELSGTVLNAIFETQLTRTIGIHNELKDVSKQQYLEYVEKIENPQIFNQLSDMEKCEFLVSKGLLYWKLGDTKALYNAKEFFELKLKTSKVWESEYLLSPASYLVSIFMEINEIDIAKQIAGEIVRLTENIMGRALVYQNQERLNAISALYLLTVLEAYSVLWYKADIKELYKVVLNFKNLISLIIEFRNITVTKMPELEKLSVEINQLLDQKAEYKKNEVFLNNKIDEQQGIEDALKKKEREFARIVNPNYIYQPFEIDEMIRNMPDNCAFVDYFIFYRDFFLGNLYTDEHLAGENEQLEIFCFVKENDICTIEKASIQLDDKFYDELYFYLEQMEKEHHKKLEFTRKVLYSYLIKPIEKYIAGMKNIYISPESSLCNLPFEVLTDNNGCMFGEKHNITLVDSGRDFIKQASGDFYNYFTVVGNPGYDYEKYLEHNMERLSLFSQEIYDLPFSELEARIVAEKLGVQPYLRNNANKNVMKQVEKSRWVHLATHGTYNVDSNEDSWYSSALLFAGVENWRRTGNMNSVYGNGMITADEISRMDLSHTEMVVLSACFTGRVGYVDMAGIRSAFRAAGVKYIIATLWSVGDLPSVIIMSKFYEYLQSKPVPEALKQAVIYLKNVTLDEVEQFFDFYAKKYNALHNPGIRKGIQWIKDKKKNGKGTDKIFSDPYYWSSYICIQNAF